MVGILFLIYTGNENAIPFNQTQCKQIDDCLHELTVQSYLGCVGETPPQQQCKWGNFDLTPIFEAGMPVVCNDNGSAKIYEYTPCQSAVPCDGQEFQATLFDQGTRDCLSLTEWDYGATQPVYFNNGGSPAWRFDYRNGAETEQCPDGINMDITWICDFECSPFCLDTECDQVNQCRYSMSIKSIYACALQEGDYDEEMEHKLLRLMQNSSVLHTQHWKRDNKYKPDHDHPLKQKK